jgi:hypothetical protein
MYSQNQAQRNSESTYKRPCRCLLALLEGFAGGCAGSCATFMLFATSRPMPLFFSDSPLKIARIQTLLLSIDESPLILSVTDTVQAYINCCFLSNFSLSDPWLCHHSLII